MSFIGAIHFRHAQAPDDGPGGNAQAMSVSRRVKLL
jgi:hypothetical protein